MESVVLKNILLCNQLINLYYIITNMSVRRVLPPIDFKNEWLNKDRELYTLIFTKTALAVALNGVNVALGSDTLTKATGRSVGNVFSGLIEMAGVSANRFIIDGGKDGDRVLALIVTDVTAGILYTSIDVGINIRLSHLEPPIPIAVIDDYIVNPLHAGMVRFFLPPEQVIALPNTGTAQSIINGLLALTNIGGSIGVVAGILATQVVKE